jgi:hypothetical protein
MVLLPFVDWAAAHGRLVVPAVFDPLRSRQVRVLRHHDDLHHFDQ